ASRWARVIPRSPPPTMPHRSTSTSARRSELANDPALDRVAETAGRALGGKGVGSLGPPREELAAAADAPHGRRGVAEDEVEIAHRPRDDRAHAHHRETADLEVVADRASGADRRPFAAARRERG